MVDYNRDDRITGALFKNRNPKGESSPKYIGDLTLTKSLLKELIEEAKAGNPVKISINAWENKSPRNIEYISLSARKWVDLKKDPALDAPF